MARGDFERFVWGGYLSVEWSKQERGKIGAIQRVIFYRDPMPFHYDITGRSLPYCALIILKELLS